MLREQIVAIRAGAAAQVAMADAILAALDGAAPPAARRIPDGCEHQPEQRMATPLFVNESVCGVSGTVGV